MTNTTNTTNIAITKGVIATTTKEASAHTLYANSLYKIVNFHWHLHLVVPLDFII